MRAFCVQVHRYAGLLLTAFLFVAGVTGSAIAFHDELDRLLNPEWFRAKAAGTAKPLTDIVASVEARYPGAYVRRTLLPLEPQGTLRVLLAPKPSGNAPPELAVDQLYVDPVSGEVLGARKWGAVRFDRAHLIPFLYELHHRLHLGQWGGRLLGAVALVWVFDCFVGLYLAWPRPTWTAVKRALGVKWRAGAHRRHYDLHRAGGLWFWAVLLTLAVSGVYFNLNREVFRPVLSVFTPVTSVPGEALPARPDPAAPPAVDWDEAVARAADALGDHTPVRLGDIRYAPSNGLYRVGFHTAADTTGRHPGAFVYIAGESGRVLAIQRPNEGTAGDIVMRWQFPLHSGQAFGLPGRILIFLTGLAVAALSVTGIAIWWRKRAARPRTGDVAVTNRAAESTTT